MDRLGYSYGTSALYRGPVSGRVQRRLTCSPGQGSPVSATGDWPGALTGFFLHRRRLLRQRQNPCVINIPFPAPSPLDWRFRLCPWHRCHGRADLGRYPSPSAPCRACPGCLTALCTGLRKLSDQKRIRPTVLRLPDELHAQQPVFSRVRPPAAPVSFDSGSLQAILPAFAVPTGTSNLFGH